MGPWYYEVVSFDGDYVNLRRTDIESDELNPVALALLPPELQAGYRPLLLESDPGTAKIVKAADKLSAYIKCVEELKAGNSEFEAAARQTRQALCDMQLPCLDYFMAHFLDSFQLTLDELE